MEALRLRVKNVDFERREIAVRDGKKRVMLPDSLTVPLKDQLAHACLIWSQDSKWREAMGMALGPEEIKLA